MHRGPYAGAVGYFSYDGNMDMAITIRTLFFHKGKAYMQAGAGIVADSDPSREHEECQHKAAALFAAVQKGARSAMILVIDNYDSFTYNLVQYIQEMSQDVEVYRNDAITVSGIEQVNPTHLVDLSRPGRSDDGRHLD